jgi:hypothetical protein
VGWLGVAIRRAVYDLPLVLAAAVIVLVASGVLVAASIYPEAVVRAGIVTSLREANPVQSSIAISIDVKPADLQTFDSTVRQLVADALGPANGETTLLARSDAYAALTNGLGPQSGGSSIFAYAEGLEAHAHLVSGAWPADEAAPPSDPTAPVDAAVSEAGASALGVQLGSLVSATSRLDMHRVLLVRIVGVFAPNDGGDAYWGGDPLLVGGIEARGSFTTVGPLFVGRQVLIDRTLGVRSSISWRAVPAFPEFSAENVGGIGNEVRVLADRLAGKLGRDQTITVTTGLPALLGAVGGQLTEARSGSTLVAGQMVVLAMYALIFVAALVVGQRRASTSQIRSRGASGRQLVALAAIEAVVIAVPAAALGLPLGLGLATLLAGGTAGIRVSGDVAILAGVAALVAVVGLTLPTVAATGPLAAVRRSPGRQRAAAFIQRSRLDLAIAALAAIALWRLRGSVSAGEVAATPLAIVGPAVGLLAGAILLLRIVPLLGTAIERALVRSGSKGRALAVRAVARRSVAAARPALLVAMSTAIAIFAGGYGLTWQASQQDQAAFTVGADIRGELPTGSTTVDGLGGARLHSVAQQAAGYEAVAGVTAAAPLAHEDFSAGTTVPSGTLVAMAPEDAGVIPFRSDLGSRPFTDLLASLQAARPSPATIPLPPGARRARVRITLPGTVAPTARLSVAIVTRDGHGLLTRLETTPALGGPSDAYVATIDPSAAGSPGLSILSVELHLAGAGDPAAAEIGVAGVEASPATGGDDAWSPVDAAAALAAWSVSPSPSAGFVAEATSLAETKAAPLDALVDPAVLAASGEPVGGQALIRHGFSTQRTLRMDGTVSGFPGQSGTGLVIVDLASFQLATYLASGSIPGPDEWRFSVQPGTDRAVVAALTGGPGPLSGLRSTALEVAARLNDPIVVAIAGMLVLAAAAAATFAVVGFVTAAWTSTKSRVPEYAVARALGLSRGSIRGWLALEQAFPAVVGLGWGFLLGIGLEWLVLPAVIHAPGGGLPVPAALVVVPSAVVLGYVAAAVVLLASTAAALARTVEGAGLVEPLRGEP